MNINIFTLVSLPLFLSLLLSCGGGQSAEEKAAWETARQKNSLEALDSFLLQYPETGRREEIAKLRDGRLWQVALLYNTEWHYKNYLAEFPQGQYKDEAQIKLEQLPTDAVSLSELSSKTFVGTINQGDQDYEVLALRFAEIEEQGDAVHFKASVHLSSDIRKQMTGTISKPKYTISFEEGSDDEILIDLSDGRAYLRDGRLILESTDPKQYWLLK